jgi:branched-chain amino acid transport system substrate-binding protein
LTGKTTRGLGIAAVAAVVALACGSQQGQTTTTTDVGITKDTITIGGTFPVSGPASAYYSVAKGANAYFEYTNANGGIGGRKIKYIVVDDAYSAANTPAKARELVQDDQVFLTYGDLGTPNNLAVRDYYNQQKVPQLFVFTGSSHWGGDYDQYPWTLGWQPDYITEGKIYAKYILTSEPTDKIGILYQNDDYGKDYVNGLKKGLGDKAGSMVVKEVTYNTGDPVDMKSQVNQLKASGADTFYVAATPNYAANAVTNAIASGWNPKLYMNNVSASTSTWRQVTGKLGAAATKVDGMISTVYYKDPLDTAKWGNDPGVKLFKDVMTKYGGALAPSQPCASDGSDGFCVAGMASAFTLVDVLKKANSDGQLTRKHVMDIACCAMNETNNPLLLPGEVVSTSKTNHFPIQQMQLEKWTGDHWVPFGSVIDARK